MSLKMALLVAEEVRKATGMRAEVCPMGGGLYCVKQWDRQELIGKWDGSSLPADVRLAV